MEYFEIYNYDTALIEEICCNSVYREEIDTVLQFQKRITAVRGRRGGGKTSLIAMTFSALKEKGYIPIPLMLKNSPYTLTADGILGQALYVISKELPNRRYSKIEEMHIPEKREALKEASGMLTQKAVALIDGIDMLTEKEAQLLLDSLPKEFNIVATMDIESTLPCKYKPYADYSFVGMHSLGAYLTELTVKKHFGDKNAKLHSILCEKYSFEQPICIGLALNRLINLSDIDIQTVSDIKEAGELSQEEAMEQYLVWLAKKLPKDKTGLIKCVLDNLAISFDESTVYNTLGLAVVSRGLLTLGEISEILNISQEKMQGLLSLTRGILYTCGERACVISDDVADLIRKDEGHCAEMLLEYFDSLPYNSELKKRLYFTNALVAQRTKSACDYLCQSPFDRDFEDLRRYLLQKDSRDDMTEAIALIIDIAVKKEPQELHRIALKYLYGILPVLTDTSCDEYGIIHEKIYNACLDRLDYEKDPNCARLTGALADKCADIKKQKSFYTDCYSITKRMYESLDKNDVMYPIIACDYALATEKLTSYLFFEELGCGNAMTEYNKAIRVCESGSCVTDMLNYTKSYVICKKYEKLIAYLSDMAIFEDGENDNEKWENQLNEELGFVTDFCTNTVESGNKSIASQPKVRYLRLLAMAYNSWASYYSIMKNSEKATELYKTCLEVALRLYELSGEAQDCNLLRGVLFWLGAIRDMDFESRKEYLERDLSLALCSLPETVFDAEGCTLDIKKTAAELKYLYFEKIHPNVKYNVENFNDEFMKNRTEATADNYRELLKLCCKYFEYAEILNLKGGINNFMTTTANQVVTVSVSEGRRIFDEGFNNISLDTDKARERFKTLIEIGEDVIKLCEKLLMIENDRAVMEIYLTRLAIHVNKMWKASHNLELLERDKWEYWLDKCDYFASEMYFACELYDLIKQKEDYKPIVNMLRDESLHKKYTCFARGEARLLDFCAKKRGLCLARYHILAVREKKKKHFYDIYQRILKDGDIQDIDSIEASAKELLSYFEGGKKFDEIVGKCIIYYSNFLECIALEKAYRDKKPQLAKKILQTGYDCYLEIGTLYIIQRYDRKHYLSVIGELKRICLTRTIEQIKKGGSTHDLSPRVLYGNSFCDELLSLCQKALEQIDPNDTSDYRNSKKIKKPKF